MQENTTNFAVSAGLQEIVNRFGSAGAEFIKGYRGHDYETGVSFERGLKQISQYKIGNENSVKQQAGFSAEVAMVSKKNAESIINKDGVRYFRSEDVQGYGSNNTVVDIVEILGNEVLQESQVKFVTNVEKLLTHIARGENGGKNDLSRYLNVDKLELPTEQVEQAKAYCRQKAEELKQQAERVAQNGNKELAEKLQRQAENFEKLESKICDSGLTTDEAIAYRLHPKWETTKDIVRVSHRAGIEGAKFGAAIGGGISLITNAISVYSGNKELSDAVFDTTTDTLKAAGVGYVTAFSGSAIKGVMQQSSSQIVRNLSKSGLPAMIVSTSLAASKIIYKFLNDEIEQKELWIELGETVNSTLATATFSMIGQVAIPIPVLGGLIGGMVGNILTNSLYHQLIQSQTDLNMAKAQREIVKMQCAAAKQLAEKYQSYIEMIFSQKIIQLDTETEQLFSVINNPNISANEFSDSVNKFAEFLGKALPYKTQEEFDQVMSSSEILIL